MLNKTVLKSKEKTLILREANPEVDIFFNEWIARGYEANVLFKKVSKPLRAIRRLFLEYNLPFSSIWYNEWYSNLDNYENIIIHMSNLTRFIPLKIHRKNPNLRIICWYWNTVNNKSIPINTNIKNIEYWSFDKNDCDKYKMNENIQYYCQPKDITKSDIKYDIYFIGRSKGREDKIIDFKKIANEHNLICNFNIIKDNSNFVKPYYEVKNDILKTKSILDINKENQYGLTLRALESLFFETKLITNNINIKNMQFYNKNNIFIIGEDDYSKLSNFVNCKYDQSVNVYKKEFELDKWFSNFFI